MSDHDETLAGLRSEGYGWAADWIERLRAERTTSDPDLCDELAVELEAERALADHLYAVLDECFNEEGMFIFEEDSFIDSVVAAKARYREARGR